MANTNDSSLRWPALDLGGRNLPAQIVYERGIWGKVHGAPSDFRWIASTPEFAAADKRLELELPLGPENESVSATLWKVRGDSCYAVAFYPSVARDAAGRSEFLEKQILEWKSLPDVPRALSALVLLPLAERLAASDWRLRWDDDDVDDDVAILADCDPVPVTLPAIAEAVDQALRGLIGVTSEEQLIEFYAALLAGGRAVSLKGLTAPVPAAALAALLLPMPREIADRISIAGWLPSTRISEPGVEDIRRSWDVVLGGSTAVPTTSAVPTDDQLSAARAMAKSVFTLNPASDVRPPAAPFAATTGTDKKPIQLALWGPSAAGKTVLLAKLYLDADPDDNAGDWEVYPTETSIKFIKDMRARMRTSNLFPEASTIAYVDRIEYLFRHPATGIVASLQLEDRAGKESEELEKIYAKNTEDSLQNRLGSADGLVLVFDPVSDQATLEGSFWNALELLHVASGRQARKDERPIAVCVSKADTLIETPADFRRATDFPDDFVRERVPEFLTDALDRFSTNYRLFPVSAVGVRLRHGVIEPAVFFDENLEPRICPGGRPFNLMAPFSWLLEQLTGAS